MVSTVQNTESPEGMAEFDKNWLKGITRNIKDISKMWMQFINFPTIISLSLQCLRQMNWKKNDAAMFWSHTQSYIEEALCESSSHHIKLKQKHGIRKKTDFIWPYFIRSNPNILYPKLWRLWGEKYLKMSFLWWFCIWIRLYIKLHSDRKPCWLASGGNGLWRTPKFLTQDTVFIWLSKKENTLKKASTLKRCGVIQNMHETPEMVSQGRKMAR